MHLVRISRGDDRRSETAVVWHRNGQTNDREKEKNGDALKRRHWVLTPEKRALIKFIAVAEVRTPYEPLEEKKSGDCLSTEDCQNSRSLCRFYSRSTRGRYEREIQASSGGRRGVCTLLRRRLLRKTCGQPTVTDLKRREGLSVSLETTPNLRRAGVSFETHGEQTIIREKDFYPRGGPRGFSKPCVFVFSNRSIRLLGSSAVGELENIQKSFCNDIQNFRGRLATN